MQTSTQIIKRIILEIKSRWKRRALMQGFALTIFTGIFVTALYAIVSFQFSLLPFYQYIGIAFAVFAVLVVFVHFVIKPAMRKLSDDQIALYIEEQIPDLEDRLISAIEIGSKIEKGGDNELINKLVNDAADKAKLIDLPTVIDRKKEQILSYSSYVLLAITFFVFYTFLDDFRQMTSEIDFSLTGFTEFQRELFGSITPGDIEIEKGQSQTIVVELNENTNNDVVLHYRSEADIWKKQVMEKGLDDPLYLYQFLNVQEPLEYFVEINQERSPVFAITLYEFPKVSGIQTAYDYPSYTGLPDRIEKNTGTISGLKGSTVTMTIETSGAVETSSIVLDDVTEISMNSLGNGKFRTQFQLEKPALYHFLLTDHLDKNNKFPEEYRIIPVDDEKPFITILEPQRDIKASPIEEILISTKVTDDYGVSEVNLNYSINGEDEESVTLNSGEAQRDRNIVGSHLLFLEDFELQPGDFIAYYIEADDYYPGNTPEMSDMYFIEISPFEQEFTQVANQGMQGAAGGGQQSQIVLNQQQLIAATWKLLKLRDDIDIVEFEESREALVQAQDNLKTNIE